jgi:hypothetical protein
MAALVSFYAYSQFGGFAPFFGWLSGDRFYSSMEESSVTVRSGDSVEVICTLQNLTGDTVPIHSISNGRETALSLPQYLSPFQRQKFVLQFDTVALNGEAFADFEILLGGEINRKASFPLKCWVLADSVIRAAPVSGGIQSSEKSVSASLVVNNVPAKLFSHTKSGDSRLIGIDRLNTNSERSLSFEVELDVSDEEIGSWLTIPFEVFFDIGGDVRHVHVVIEASLVK